MRMGMDLAGLAPASPDAQSDMLLHTPQALRSMPDKSITKRTLTSKDSFWSIRIYGLRCRACRNCLYYTPSIYIVNLTPVENYQVH